MACSRAGIRIRAWDSASGAARAKTWSGLLATAGGLIFYGQPNGSFTAADQRTDKNSVAISNERPHERLADDVHNRRESI
jgi:hypothetical protein